MLLAKYKAMNCHGYRDLASVPRQTFKLAYVEKNDMDFFFFFLIQSKLLHQYIASFNPNICFQDAIEKLLSSGNVDNPEGGLDALVQVAVCDKVCKQFCNTFNQKTRASLVQLLISLLYTGERKITCFQIVHFFFLR